VDMETTTNTATAEMDTATTQQQSAQEVNTQDAAPAKEDIAALVTKESRKNVEKLLKDAGITPSDNPEMQLKEYKKWLDGQKSDLERAQSERDALTSERDTAIAEKNALERRFDIVSKGVPADRADKYIKLAEAYESDSVDFASAVDLALKDFPITTTTQKAPGGGANPPAATPPISDPFIQGFEKG